MPYIKSADRVKFDRILKECPVIATKGELEYVVYSLMVKYMQDKEFRYSTLHDCVYAVQHCSDEYRRRSLDVREDAARIENGDI